MIISVIDKTILKLSLSVQTQSTRKRENNIIIVELSVKNRVIIEILIKLSQVAT